MIWLNCSGGDRTLLPFCQACGARPSGHRPAKAAGASLGRPTLPCFWRASTGVAQSHRATGTGCIKKLEILSWWSCHPPTIRVNSQHEQRSSAPRRHNLASHGGRPAGGNRASQVDHRQVAAHAVWPSSEKIDEIVGQLELALEELETGKADGRIHRNRSGGSSPGSRLRTKPCRITCPAIPRFIRLKQPAVRTAAVISSRWVRYFGSARLRACQLAGSFAMFGRKLACGSCDTIVQAPAAPSWPITRGMAGSGLLAHVLVAKYCDHLPCIGRVLCLPGRLGQHWHSSLGPGGVHWPVVASRRRRRDASQPGRGGSGVPAMGPGPGSLNL